MKFNDCHGSVSHEDANLRSQLHERCEWRSFIPFLPIKNIVNLMVCLGGLSLSRSIFRFKFNSNNEYVMLF